MKKPLPAIGSTHTKKTNNKDTKLSENKDERLHSSF